MLPPNNPVVGVPVYGLLTPGNVEMVLPFGLLLPGVTVLLLPPEPL